MYCTIDTYSCPRHEASGEDPIAGDEGAATDGMLVEMIHHLLLPITHHPHPNIFVQGITDSILIYISSSISEIASFQDRVVDYMDFLT